MANHSSWACLRWMLRGTLVGLSTLLPPDERYYHHRYRYQHIHTGRPTTKQRYRFTTTIVVLSPILPPRHYYDEDDKRQRHMSITAYVEDAGPSR